MVLGDYRVVALITAQGTCRRAGYHYFRELINPIGKL